MKDKHRDNSRHLMPQQRRLLSAVASKKQRPLNYLRGITRESRVELKFKRLNYKPNDWGTLKKHVRDGVRATKTSDGLTVVS